MSAPTTSGTAMSNTQKPALHGLAAKLLPITTVAALLAATVLAFSWLGSEYAYLAGYTILQYVLLATAWNILGGYAGYVNFGVAGFFAIGVYGTVALQKAFDAPLLVAIPVVGLIAGAVGFGMGYLTLRLRGVYFSIATLAFTVVLSTLVVNWNYVGGARGAQMMRPESAGVFGSYVQFLFTVMLVMAVASVLIARGIERSWIGKGLAALREDELAAESCGVPALRLKLFATTISGALLGIAGAPYPYYVTYVDPSSAFSLSIAVNAIAMPLLGGTATWIGPVIGAVTLGGVQQIATVMISSAANLLIVGVVLVLTNTLAPNGIVGLLSKRGRRQP